MREPDSVKINEALRDEVHDCIETCREQSSREIKKAVWQIAEKHLPGVEKKTIKSAIKEILVDFLIGDRRLKLPHIRKILTDYRNIEQLILMVSKLYGKGTIGSKALGLETAYAILNNAAVRRKHQITLPVYKPDSYYLGSNLLLDFFNHNKHLGKYRRLKNETFEKIITAQEELEHDFMSAKMPASVMQYLEKIIREIDRPIIVRSSSKLEDNVDASFAGQYASFFLANEGSFEDRLDALEYAVRKTWRSLFSADAIVYRIKMGFLHRDEQMGILLQRVIGRKFDVKYLDSDTGEEKIRRFFAPTVAAVGFSRNLIYILSNKMKQEDGIVRLVLGLGTRAVERKFAYEASLSLPSFLPERNPYLRKKMSQAILDCIDLTANTIVSIPIGWAAKYSGKFYDLIQPFIAILKEGYLRKPTSHFDIEYKGTLEERRDENIVVDFHSLLQLNTKWKGYSFAKEFRNILQALEENFGHPVDVEFAININNKGIPKFYILQSRALVEFNGSKEVTIPSYRKNELLIENNECLTHGFTGTGSNYLIYVDSLEYKNYPDKAEVARAIGKIVHHPDLRDEGIIAILPGRTGSNNPELGVPVRFNEISEINGLVEYGDDVLTSDISYGTHFYTGMKDVKIGLMPVQKKSPKSFFNDEFFRKTKSVTAEFIPNSGIGEALRVIRISDIFKNKKAFMYLNGVEKRGVLLLRKA